MKAKKRRRWKLKKKDIFGFALIWVTVTLYVHNENKAKNGVKSNLLHLPMRKKCDLLHLHMKNKYNLLHLPMRDKKLNDNNILFKHQTITLLCY